MAYDLWREVESTRVSLALSKVELAKRTGLARTTIDGLRGGARPPTVNTVHALADALNIDRRHAEALAGLRPTEPAADAGLDVRAAIEASPHYTEEQRRMLLAMVDTIEEANGLKEKSVTSPERRAN